MAASERARSYAVAGLVGVLLVLTALWLWGRGGAGHDLDEERSASSPRRGARPMARPRAPAPPRISPSPPSARAEEDSAAEAAAPRVIDVRCRAEAPLLDALVEVIVAGRAVEFFAEGEELVVSGVPTEGVMTLWMKSSPPLQVAWDDQETPGLGRCREEPLALIPAGSVSGVIPNRGRWPQSWVVVRVCGVMVRPDAEGRFESYARVGVCDVVAQRRDGLFFASSEVVTLEVGAGEEHELELWLPDYRQGGVGMGISEHEEGVLVERVLPGGAAAEAGLAPGDVVLEVDGVPAAALTLEEFVQVTTGEAGTEVELVISRGEGSDREESIFLLDRRVME